MKIFNSISDQIHQLPLDSNLDFLCLSETWLNENHHQYYVFQGITFIEDKVGSKGGGVSVFVKECFQCHEIQWSCNKLECIGLNVTLSTSMFFSLIVLYRPLSSNNSFYEHFENMLE